MNLFKKNICIIGFNQAIGNLLVTGLLHKNPLSIDIIAFPSDTIHPYLLKHPQNKVRVLYTNQVHIKDIMNYDMVVNISLCPTPANLAYHWRKKLNFNKKLFEKFHESKIKPKVIQVSPLIKKNIFSTLLNDIHNIDNLASKYETIIIKTPSIIATQDSINTDIYNTIHQYQAYTTYKNIKISTVGSKNLVDNILNQFQNVFSPKTYEIGLTKQISIKDLIIKIINANGINYPIKRHKFIVFKLYNLMAKLHISSFSHVYLNFLNNSKIVSQNDADTKTNSKRDDIDVILKESLPYQGIPFYNYNIKPEE